MTREVIADTIATWMPRLGLTHWSVTLDTAEPSEECEAQTLVDDWYDHATVRFAADAVAWDDRHAELVVIHELLHLTTRDLKRSVEESIEALPGATARALARSRFIHELEGHVDRTAAALLALVEEAF